MPAKLFTAKSLPNLDDAVLFEPVEGRVRDAHRLRLVRVDGPFRVRYTTAKQVPAPKKAADAHQKLCDELRESGVQDDNLPELLHDHNIEQTEVACPDGWVGVNADGEPFAVSVDDLKAWQQVA